MASDRGEYRSITRQWLNGPHHREVRDPDARHLLLLARLTAGRTGLFLATRAELVARLSDLSARPPEAVGGRLLPELEEAGRIWVDDSRGVVWVGAGHLADDVHTTVSNEQNRKGVRAHVAGFPRCAVVAAFVVANAEWFMELGHPTEVLTWARAYGSDAAPSVVPPGTPPGPPMDPPGTPEGPTGDHRGTLGGPSGDPTGTIEAGRREKGEGKEQQQRAKDSRGHGARGAKDPVGEASTAAPPASSKAKPSSAPKYPHYPMADTRALHERWTQTHGPVKFDRFRAETAPLYASPDGPVHPLSDLLHAVDAHAEYVATLAPKEARWQTPAAWVTDVHRWVKLGAQAYMDADLRDTPRGRLLEQAWEPPAAPSSSNGRHRP